MKELEATVVGALLVIITAWRPSLRLPSTFNSRTNFTCLTTASPGPDQSQGAGQNSAVVAVFVARESSPAKRLESKGDRLVSIADLTIQRALMLRRCWRGSALEKVEYQIPHNGVQVPPT
jgi:hypothetical protein